LIVAMSSPFWLLNQPIIIINLRAVGKLFSVLTALLD
jgi:hypothetical protein